MPIHIKKVMVHPYSIGVWEGDGICILQCVGRGVHMYTGVWEGEGSCILLCGKGRACSCILLCGNGRVHVYQCVGMGGYLCIRIDIQYTCKKKP